MSVGKQQGVESSDCLREENVVESAGAGTDAPVPSATWQEGEESMRERHEMLLDYIKFKWN